MSLLDKPPPFDPKDPASKDLWSLLSRAYYTRGLILALVQEANLSYEVINFDQAAKWVWRERARGRVPGRQTRDLVETIERSDGLRPCIAELVSDIHHLGPSATNGSNDMVPPSSRRV